MNLRRQRGFSLLEVVVALLVVSLILLLAVQLLGEVQTTTVEVQRTLPDSVPQLAIQLLRHDIQRSRQTLTSPGSGPLALALADGSQVVYDEWLGELQRTVVAPDGTVTGRRAVMRDVRLWSWQHTLAPGLIQLQIVYRKHRDPGGRRFGGVGAVQDPRIEDEVLALRFTQRARPGRSVF